MKTILAVKCARRKPDDLLLWADDFVCSPARTERDIRERRIVADLRNQVGTR